MKSEPMGIVQMPASPPSVSASLSFFPGPFLNDITIAVNRIIVSLALIAFAAVRLIAALSRRIQGI